MKPVFFLVLLAALLSACGSGRDLSAVGLPAPALGAKAPSALDILVIGGTKGIGLETVKFALARGHSVTATARRPERMEFIHGRLQTLKGDITDAESIAELAKGKDAIVVAVGIGPTREPVSVFSMGMDNVVQAMNQQGVRRLSFVTGIGAGDSRGHGGFSTTRYCSPCC